MEIIVLVFMVVLIALYPEQARLELNQKNSKKVKAPIDPKPAYAVSAVMAGKEISDKDFTAYTLRVFQPLTSRKLTEEDAREITQNTVGFLNVLIDWKAGKGS